MSSQYGNTRSGSGMYELLQAASKGDMNALIKSVIVLILFYTKENMLSYLYLQSLSESNIKIDMARQVIFGDDVSQN